MIVIIGGGLNGLACAVELSRRGKKTILLEQRAELGGLSASRTFGDGFVAPGVRHDTSDVRPALLESLGLSLRVRSEHVPIYQAGGAGMLVRHAAIDGDDAKAYADMRAFFARLRPLLEALLARPAPPLLPASFAEAMSMGTLGLKLRALGRDDMLELMRLAPMCVADWLRSAFTSELLSATLALPALLGDFVGPWSPGTGINLLLGEALAEPGLAGGPASLVQALKTAAAAQCDIRTATSVERIVVERGAVRGVVLANGETLAADVVIGACHAKHLLVRMLPPQALDAHAKSAARAIRTRGTAAKVHLGLKARPEWRGQQHERVRIGADLETLERAFDAVKYRRLAERPALDIWMPSEISSGGKPMLSVLVSGAPYDLQGGWTPEAKAQLLERVLTTLEAHAPGLRDIVQASEVLSPVDLEREYGAVGGSLHHVERALDQLLFLRPARMFARGTPVQGLYLGSSGCHGGPGATLLPGVLAARAVE